MQNLLVPTDFSAESHHAFGVALRIAQRTGGSVTLLHVVDLPEGASFSTFGGPVDGDEAHASGGEGMERLFVMKLLQVTKHRMHDLITEAHRTAAGVPVHDMVATNRVIPAILEVITSRQIDLVVIGAQGHTALDHFLMGSNTERLIRTAPCPVLTVKRQQGDFEVKNIVFPSDFSAETDQAVPMIHQVQALFPDARLHLLHVIHGKKGTDAADRMQAFIDRHHLQHAAIDLLVDASERTGISHFAEQTNADLVLLPTHGYTGVSRYLHPHIAENVATHTAPPVLTFRL